MLAYEIQDIAFSTRLRVTPTGAVDSRIPCKILTMHTMKNMPGKVFMKILDQVKLVSLLIIRTSG